MVATGRFMLPKGSKFRKEERKEGRGNGKRRRKEGGKKVKRVQNS